MVRGTFRHMMEKDRRKSKTHFSKKKEKKKHNLRKSPQMCRLWCQRRDSYGSIPSCWPLKMSNVLLSSLGLPQDEFSATLSSPLPLLMGLKTTQSLLWRHSNLRTCSDVSFFVILFVFVFVFEKWVSDSDLIFSGLFSSYEEKYLGPLKYPE